MPQHDRSSRVQFVDSPTTSQNEEPDCSKLTLDFTLDEIVKMKNLNAHDNEGSDCSSTQAASSRPSTTRSSIGRSSFASSLRSVSSTGSSPRNIWSKMTERGTWSLSQSKPYSDDFIEEQDMTWAMKCMAFWRGVLGEFRHFFKTTRNHPCILLYTAIVLTFLTAMAFQIVNLMCRRNVDKLKHVASMEALETATWFSETFSRTMIPLRSLQQAVMHSEYFKSLPEKIGPYGVDGSAPPIYGARSKDIPDYRNVTNICNDEEMQQKFNSIVSSITKNFEFEGIIVNYRLAPYGVFCVIDPLVNTEDFEDGKIMNSEKSIGWDPMNSGNSRWSSMLHDIYSTENEIAVWGPFKNDIMEEFFCGHLSVDLPEYNLIAQDKVYNSWGFVMHFVNWEKMKERSGIFQRFDEKGLRFHLFRTDIVKDKETGEFVEKNITLAQSPSFENGESQEMGMGFMVEIEIDTPNGKWKMQIWDACDIMGTLQSTKLATAFGALCISLLFTLVLIERQQHKLLLYKIMPKTAIEKLNRGHTVVDRYNIVTIFFSDIVGFTSMAGELSPLQVMEMLNELYNNFDKIAARHKVYKVETIGDAYMVVGGAPDRCPAPEAAQKVALFALEAVEFVRNFETANGNRIKIRCGLASGPVVAGVVGTAMPRFCFFGDTVNFASRMESTSKTMKIQCNDLTARLLQDAPDYSFNMKEREEDGIKGVQAKGKGLVKSWWIECVDALYEDVNDLENPGLKKTYRGHIDTTIQTIALSKQDWASIGQSNSGLVAASSKKECMIDRIYAMLEYRLSLTLEKRSKQKSLNAKAKSELKEYVRTIASLYNDIEYHNFEHASHVTISMNKLIDTLIENQESKKTSSILSKDIRNEPFVHFSLIFSCLIHDVGHLGQGNKILAVINHQVASRFKEASAERNSIDIAFRLLFGNRFRNIRKVILPNIKDRLVFGKIVFWAILSSDIASPERLKNNKARFDALHAARNSNSSNNSHEFDRKLCPIHPYLIEFGTLLKLSKKNLDDHSQELILTKQDLERCVLIEHLMQVTDVSHLMQNFENFVKWNYRLYKELMVCQNKNLIPNPTPTWASGQIGFFDFYIIPLAERAEMLCGDALFETNLSENARHNKARWEEEGETISAIFANGYSAGDPEIDILLNASMGIDA